MLLPPICGASPPPAFADRPSVSGPGVSNSALDRLWGPLDSQEGALVHAVRLLAPQGLSAHS